MLIPLPYEPPAEPSNKRKKAKKRPQNSATKVQTRDDAILKATSEKLRLFMLQDAESPEQIAETIHGLQRSILALQRKRDKHHKNKKRKK